MSTWTTREPGVFALPSGRLVRGRALSSSQQPSRSRPVPSSQSAPSDARADFELILLGTHRQFEAQTAHADEVGDGIAIESRWVKWPDFRLPSDQADAAVAFAEAWARASSERVGVACAGGRGRTGTALACLAILDGVPSAEAVAFVREHYHPRAVETPWQRRFVEHFTAETAT
ncbi:protein-tyrosine phosphatase family protein [Brevibacterium casei]